MSREDGVNENIRKWREERQKRLLERIFRRTRAYSDPGNHLISAAVLGIKNPTDNQKNHRTGLRFSVKPKSPQKTTFNMHTSEKLKQRFSHGNLKQRHSTISCNNHRQSMMKINKVDKLAMKKLIKNDAINVQTEILENRTPLASVGNKNITEATSPQSCFTSDKHNSTFTLTNDDDEENLLSPVEKLNDKVDKIGLKNPCSRPQSILRQPKKSLQVADMSKKLHEWASSKGKPLENYRHLNCFVSQIPKTICKTPLPVARKVQFKLSGGKTIFTPKNTTHCKIDEPITLAKVQNPKPATVTSVIVELEENGPEQMDLTAGNELTASTPEEQLRQPTSLPPMPVEQPSTCSEDLKIMTVGALNDLLSLIQGNYSLEACEEWLMAIRQRNIDVDELPQYWECVAAIEEARGNMYLALDSYQRAVEQGAEVKHIETCLDRMYEKLKALNISAKEEEKENSSGDRSNNAVCHSAKNKDIFKSTIISFALIQKKVKQLNLEAGKDGSSVKYFVTPVRRSARFSTAMKNSPVTISNTVKKLLPDDDDINENHTIEFKTNKALLKYV